MPLITMLPFRGYSHPGKGDRGLRILWGSRGAGPGRLGPASPGESVCERKRDRLQKRKMKPGCPSAPICAPLSRGTPHHGAAHRHGLKASPTLPISQGFLPPARPRSQARLRQAPLHSGSNIPAQSSRYPDRMALSSALPESRSKTRLPTDSPHCLLSSRSSLTFEGFIPENPASPPLSCIPI